MEFSIVPIHTETDSISTTVARVAQVVRQSSLPHEIHAMGTIAEGDLDSCLDLVKDCLREALQDVSRVTASVRLDVRPGHAGRLQRSVQSVEEKLERRVS